MAATYNVRGSRRIVLYHSGQERPRETAMQTRALPQPPPTINRRMRFIGSAEKVAAEVRASYAAGTLVTRPESLRGQVRYLANGEVYVDVTVRVPVPPRQSVAAVVAPELGKALGFAAVVAAGVAGLLVAVFYGLLTVVQRVHGGAALGALVVVVALLLAARPIGRACRGLHCGGCENR
jgi:uncharacterized MnhB-related membrane protein